MPIHVKVLQSVLLGLVLLLMGCDPKPPKTAQPTPLDVEVAGGTTAHETADVRPRVRAGQTLYEIGRGRRGLDPP
jgi:hypothetical protein